MDTQNDFGAEYLQAMEEGVTCYGGRVFRLCSGEEATYRFDCL